MAGQGKSRRTSKGANQPDAKAAPARRHHSRLNVDPEESTRLMLMAAVVGIVVVALGIIGFGYWYSVIKPRSRTVLQVDSVKVSYSAMKRRMAYEALQNQAYLQSQSAVTALPEAVVQTLTREIIIDLKAESDLGITITDDELTQKLNAAVGLGSNTDSKAFADALKKQLAATGLTDAEFRRKVRVELLTTKINAKFTSEVPASVMQAKVDVIQTDTEADAQTAADRVKAGEDWATVAKALSKESGLATTGGVHDYAPEGTLNPAYDAQAFSSNVGEVVGPLTAADGTYYVIRVEDRAEKPVTDAQKPQLAQKAFSDWITKMESALTIKQDFDTQSQNDALSAILPGVIAKLQEQAAQQQQQQQQQQAQPTAAVPPTAESQPQPTAAAGEQSPAPVAPTPGGGNGQ
jgi:hypothetical protein